MKKRWRTWLLGSFLASVSLFVVWSWANHNRARRALAEYVQGLMKAGERLSIRELIPAPAPKELDGTTHYRQAEALMRGQTGLLTTNPPVAMVIVAPGKAMIGWQQPEIRGWEATNSWEEVQAELDVKADALELLQQLIERPWVDREIDYEQGHNLGLGGASGYTATARLLATASLAALYFGNTDQAVKGALALLALVEGRAEERLYVTQLLRLNRASMAFNLNWELLQSPELTEAQLSTLQRKWEALELLLPAERALEMERAFLIQTSREAKESRRAFNQFAAPWFGPRPTATASPANWVFGAWDSAKAAFRSARNHARHGVWQVFWADADELKALKGTQVILESFRQAGRTGAILPAIQEQERRFVELGLVKAERDESTEDSGYAERDTRTLLSESALLNAYLLKRVLTAEATRNLLVTAIALKRHQLRHGRLPEELAELLPEFFSQIPRDPVDGQPLRYRRQADGRFLLYSIGADGVDDSGDARAPNPDARFFALRSGRDWVWALPATAEEIAAYEEARGHRD